MITWLVNIAIISINNIDFRSPGTATRVRMAVDIVNGVASIVARNDRRKAMTIKRLGKHVIIIYNYDYSLSSGREEYRNHKFTFNQPYQKLKTFSEKLIKWLYTEHPKHECFKA